MENASFPWDDWPAMIRVDPKLATAFLGEPRRIELRPNSVIGRFMTPNESALLSPWWTPVSTLERIADRSAETGAGIHSVARANLAVPQEWNRTMSQLGVFRVLRSYRGLLGRAAPQHTDDRRWVGGRLPGNEIQLYLPGLKRQHLVPLGSALTYFASPRSTFSH